MKLGGEVVRSYIEERAVIVAKYILEKNTTVRQTAKTFGVSKSTIHKDVTERLEEINPSLALEVKRVLEKNKSERDTEKFLVEKEIKYEREKKV
mgnify:CR=1 FL=1